ncbi:MAG: PqqD family protein [Actinomycetota bacterium]
MSQYARREGVMSVELEGDTVLLDTLSGQYFRLNTTATLVWSLLEHASSVDELARQVHAHTEVDPDILRGDLAELLESLEQQQLVVAS